VHNTKYLSVKCAVLTHLSFTCVPREIDFGVVCLHVSNIKCDGSWSHIWWVLGHTSDGSMGHGSIPMTHCLLWCTNQHIRLQRMRAWCAATHLHVPTVLHILDAQCPVIPGEYPDKSYIARNYSHWTISLPLTVCTIFVQVFVVGSENACVLK